MEQESELLILEESTDLIPKNFEGRIDVLLWKIGVSAGKLADKIAESFNLSRAHAAIINLLAETGPLSQQKIVDTLLIDRTTMVNLIDEMVKEDMVERCQDPNDRRANKISLKEKGRELNTLGIKMAANIQEQILTPLPEKDRLELIRILTSLADHGHLPNFFYSNCKSK